MRFVYFRCKKILNKLYVEVIDIIHSENYRHGSCYLVICCDLLGVENRIIYMMPINEPQGKPLNTLWFSDGDIDLGQHWLWWWLAAWWHQVVTWTNVDFSLVRSCGMHLRAISQSTILYNELEDHSFEITTASPRRQRVKECNLITCPWLIISFTPTHQGNQAPYQTGSYFNLLGPSDAIWWHQHWLRYWLTAWQHQATTWTNVE